MALAVELLWSFCLDAGAAGPDGTTLANCGQALQGAGQPTLSAWPYNATLGSGTEPPPAGAGTAPWHTARLTSVSVAHDGEEDAIELELASGRPVALILEVTPELEHPDADGEIAIPPITAAIGDYHAMLVVGVATEQRRSRRRLLLRNTWGALWGLGGYAWLPLAYLVTFAVDASVIDTTSLSP